MSTKEPIIPTTKNDQISWFHNFVLKLPAHATELGLTAAQIAANQADYAMAAYVVEGVVLAKSELAKKVAFKNEMLDGNEHSALRAAPATATLPVAPAAVAEGINKRLADTIILIKGNKNYTAAIGEDLGIEAREASKAKAIAQPTLTISSEGGKITLKWKKNGFKAIDIYVDRNDGKGFVFLMTSLSTSFSDNYELPTGVTVGSMSYKARYRTKDEPCGNFSNIVVGSIVRTLSK